MEFLSPADAGFKLALTGGPSAWAMVPSDDRPSARRRPGDRMWYVPVVTRDGSRWYMPADLVLAWRIARQPDDVAWLEELIAHGQAIEGDQLTAEQARAQRAARLSQAMAASDAADSPASKLPGDLVASTTNVATTIAGTAGRVLGGAANVVGSVAGATVAGAFAGLGPVGMAVVLVVVGVIAYRALA